MIQLEKRIFELKNQLEVTCQSHKESEEVSYGN